MSFNWLASFLLHAMAQIGEAETAPMHVQGPPPITGLPQTEEAKVHKPSTVYRESIVMIFESRVLLSDWSPSVMRSLVS